MKTLALTLGLTACLALTGRADDKKDGKKLDLTGKYTLVDGKKNGGAVDDKAKKATYTITADAITIAGGDAKFVISYKVKPDTSPAEIDLTIADGPDGSKGTPAVGIVELKGDTLKLAYSLDKEKRPKNFDGKDGFLFELKKDKAK
jgi:uncharacterized protein (TIGR03067 family)